LKNLFLALSLLIIKTGISQSVGNVNLVSNALFIPSEKTIFYKLGDRTIPITVSLYGTSKELTCISLHDNEFTSVDAARSVLAEKGGMLIKIDNKRKSIIRFRLKGKYFAFDPNGIFSNTGIERTLKENSSISEYATIEIEKFAERLLNLIPGEAKCVIALHNNTESGYSVKSYLTGANRQKEAKDVSQNPDQDEDDLVFTTDSTVYRKMAEYGFNSVLQDNKNATKDGSLSVYFGELNKRYVNIETQHGRINQYIDMMEKLLYFLSLEKEN
jgi:hypothetical protein